MGKILITEDDTALAAEGISEYVPPAVSYFKKFFAKHSDWYNKTIETYEGFSVTTNLTIDNFKKKFSGKIKSVSIDGNIVKIEAVDVLTDLKESKYPAPTNNVSLKKPYEAESPWSFKANNASLLTTGLVAIDKMIMNVSSISTVSGKCFVNSVGDFFTVTTDAGKGAAVQKCGYYTPQNPFDIMLDLLTSQASVAATSVDTAAFVAMKSWPGRECYFTQVIPQPVSIDELYQDLLRMTECRSWVNEDQKITIGRGFLKNSTSAWAEISDSANIIEGSESVKLDAEQCITQGSLDWDLRVGMAKSNKTFWKNKADPLIKDSTSLYSRNNIYCDTVMESSHYHGKKMDIAIQTGWLHTSNSYPSSDIGGHMTLVHLRLQHIFIILLT